MFQANAIKIVTNTWESLRRLCTAEFRTVASKRKDTFLAEAAVALILISGRELQHLPHTIDIMAEHSRFSSETGLPDTSPRVTEAQPQGQESTDDLESLNASSLAQSADLEICAQKIYADEAFTMPTNIDGIIRLMDKLLPRKDFHERQKDSRGGTSKFCSMRRWTRKKRKHPHFDCMSCFWIRLLGNAR